MRKIVSLLSVFVLLVGSGCPIGSVIAHAEGLNALDRQNINQNESSVPVNKEDEQQSETENSSAIISSERNHRLDLPVDELEENVVVTFKTDSEHQFKSGRTSHSKELSENGQLKASELPTWSKRESERLFSGWLIGDARYSNEELLHHDFSENQTITATFRERNRAGDGWTVDDSISHIFTDGGADKSHVILIPSTDGEDYKDYGAGGNYAFDELLYDLYKKNDRNGEYVIYLGTSFNLPIEMVTKSSISNPEIEPMNFSSLEGRVKKLVFTGNPSDEITEDAPYIEEGKPGGSTKLHSNGLETYFGCNMVFRNIEFGTTPLFGSEASLYMNGHDLEFRGGTKGINLNIYGGSDSGDVWGSPKISLNGHISDTWNVYGGNKDGGTLTGDPEIILNKVTGNITGVYGGARHGEVSGNTKITINEVDGRIEQIQGGGLGETEETPAHVTGDVTTVIQNQNKDIQMEIGTSATPFYGGVKYGNIGGSVRTKITGVGKFTASQYVGGSGFGNIGTSDSPTKIRNNFDISQFESGNPYFTGGNLSSGFIYGSIVNKIKTSSENGKSSLGDFTGGSGTVDKSDGYLNKSKIMGDKTDEAYNALSRESRLNFARATADMRIEGKITNKLLGGVIAKDADAVGGSRGGIVIGDIENKIGSESPVSGDYDFAGGGGGRPLEVIPWSNYIAGNITTTVLQASAESIYGGGYSGVIDGHTSVTVNDGTIKNILAGGGYANERIFGDIETTVSGGKIDASVGAAYNTSNGQLITGNTITTITGGDFSGTPTHGFGKTLSGGLINRGVISGTSKLNLNIRQDAEVFNLAVGTNIFGGNTFLTDTSLSGLVGDISLTILTRENDDLNGANIFGDGGGRMEPIPTGKITMNIQAANSDIGKIYGTNYGIVYQSKIFRDITMNIQGLKSVEHIAGGNERDNITNLIAANSTNQVSLNFGVNLDETNTYQKNPIKLTGAGITNFTNLNVTNGIHLLATKSNGGIKNGRSSSADQYVGEYDKFGEIRLSNGAGIGIASDTTNCISGSKLIVTGGGKIESPPGEGNVNLSAVEIDQDSGSYLTWIKNTLDSKDLISSQGSYFGKVKAYQVLTINPNENALGLTPFNFRGIEKETGLKLIGDNDVARNEGSGYGIAIPEDNLIARHVIITEAEAKGLTRNSALDYLGLGDDTAFTNNLNDQLEQIKKPLPENQIFKKYPVTFELKNPLGDWGTQVVNLVVVRDGSDVSVDRSVALYAQDTVLTLMEANNLADQAALAQYTRATVIFADDRAETQPALGGNSFAEIQGTTEVPSVIETPYSYGNEAMQRVALTVKVTVIGGELTLKEIPKTIDFGNSKVSSYKKSFWGDLGEEKLIVEDTRITDKNAWQLTVRESVPLKNGDISLAGCLYFVDGKQEKVIGDEENIVMTSTEKGEYVVSDSWSNLDNKGLKLVVPVEKQRIGEYEGTLEWTLGAVPENKD